jgi:hypothetical protein
MHRLVNRGGQLAKFNKRFAGITGSKKEEAAPAAEAASKGDKIKLTTSASSVKKGKEKA